MLALTAPHLLLGDPVMNSMASRVSCTPHSISIALPGPNRLPNPCCDSHKHPLAAGKLMRAGPRVEGKQSAQNDIHWGPLVAHFRLRLFACTCIQGPIWAVGTSSRWLTPLLTTHTGSAPSSWASSMYSYRPSPAGRLLFHFRTPTLYSASTTPEAWDLHSSHQPTSTTQLCVILACIT